MYWGDEMSCCYVVDICIVLCCKGSYYDYCFIKDIFFLFFGYLLLCLGFFGFCEGFLLLRNRVLVLGFFIFCCLGIFFFVVY